MGNLRSLARVATAYGVTALLAATQGGIAVGGASAVGVPPGCSIVPAVPPVPGPAIESLLTGLRPTSTSTQALREVAGTGTRTAIVGVKRVRDLDRLLRLAGVRSVRVEPRLRFASVRAPARVLRSVAGRAWVRYVESPNAIEWAQTPPDPYVTTADPATGMAYAWQLGATHALEALAATPGNPNYVIGVVDTGADVGHPDLRDKVVCTNGDVVDTVGHGTFVSALAAGGVDDGVGVAGTGGASRLAIVRDDLFTDDSLAAGIRLATDQGARVINLSFGGPAPSRPLADAVEYAARRGVLLVAAAGNEASNAPSYPAIYLQPPSSNGARSLGLSVGASDQYGGRAWFSNFGDWVSLAAPGAWSSPTCPELGVFSAVPANANLIFDDGDCANVVSVGGARWAYAEGTSFAAPMVAGAAALVWSVNPDLKNFQVGDILKRSATRPPGQPWSPELGAGVLNVAAAVDLARHYDSVAPQGTLSGPPKVWADPNIPIRWSAHDEGFGGVPSGVATYELDVRDGREPAQRWRSATKPGNGTFSGRIGRTYTFALHPCDAAGNASDAEPVTVTLVRSRARLRLRTHGFTVRRGARFVVTGGVETLTPGGASALGAGVALTVFARADAAAPRILARGHADADARFTIDVRAPATGRYRLVVELAENDRLLGAYSHSVPLISHD
jgi:subtilisin family serine protease